MEHVKKTIEELKRAVEEKENDVLQNKKMVNSLCEMVKMAPVYTIKEERESPSVTNLRGDEYYGKPLASVITEILERRKALGTGPAAIREMFEEMKAGGYLFETKSDANSQRGIRISMRKNSKFHKLPNGKWGLLGWYPNIKESKKADDTRTPEKQENKTLAGQQDEEHEIENN